MQQKHVHLSSMITWYGSWYLFIYIIFCEYDIISDVNLKYIIFKKSQHSQFLPIDVGQKDLVSLTLGLSFIFYFILFF